MRPTIFLILTGIVTLPLILYCQSAPIGIHEWVEVCMDAILWKAYKEKRALVDSEKEILQTFDFSKEYINEKYDHYRLFPFDNDKRVDNCIEAIFTNAYIELRVLTIGELQILHAFGLNDEEIKDKNGFFILKRDLEESTRNKENEEGTGRLSDDSCITQQKSPYSILHTAVHQTVQPEGILGANLPAMDNGNEGGAAGISDGSDTAPHFPAAASRAAASDKPQTIRAPKRDSRKRSRNKAPPSRRSLRLSP